MRPRMAETLAGQDVTKTTSVASASRCTAMVSAVAPAPSCSLAQQDQMEICKPINKKS